MISIGGGGGSEQSSEIVDLTPTQFRGLRPEVAAALEALIATGGAGFGQAPGTTGGAGPTAPLVAPVTPNEQQLLAQLMQQAQPNAAQLAGSDLLQRTIQGEFLDPASNPFLSAAIQAEQNRLAENFRLIEAPLLQSRFTQAGHSIQPQGSSAFDTAAAIGLRGLIQAQSDISTRALADNFARERTAQQAAVTTAQNISTSEAERVTAILQQQALPRLIEQHGIELGLEEFRRRMEMILAALGIAGQVSQPVIATESQGETKPTWEFGVGFGGS